MSVEIQWKGPPVKKPRLAKIVGEDNDDQERREIILEISSSGIKTDKVIEEKKPLVIPLVESHNDSRHFAGGPREALSLEKQAELEIIEELTGKKPHDPLYHSTMVISSEEKPVAESGPGKKSLLMALIQRQKESDQSNGKLDLDSHANDLDFKSEVYDAVPVQEFGAALLRGMGWHGDVASEGDKKLEHRQGRLGLGAAAFPGKVDPKQAKSTKGVAIDVQKTLTKESLVEIQKEEHSGKRAEVVISLGVPGLNMIRVALESTGELVDVKRGSVRLLRSEELAVAPFVRGHAIETENIPTLSQKEEEDPLNLKQFKVDHIKKTSKEKVKSSSQQESSSRSVEHWVRPGLRIKIISKKVAPDAYLQKGTVFDVHRPGVATVRLDNGKMVDDVKEKYLETVLPQVGALCMILHGNYKNEVAKLVERNDKDQTVAVELVDSLEMLIMSMDDISAFTAS